MKITDALFTEQELRELEARIAATPNAAFIALSKLGLLADASERGKDTPMAIEDSPMWSLLRRFRDMMLIGRFPEEVQAIRRIKVHPESYFELIHQRDREHLGGYLLPGKSGMEAFGVPLERENVPYGELAVEMADGHEVILRRGFH